MSRCSTDFPDAEPLAARDVGGQALLNTALSNDERNQAADDLPQLTVRAILGGLAIGTVLCFTNMYFGLQTGWVTMGSIQCAVVGFAVFRFCAPASSRVLSMHENVVLQAVGVATATAPLSAGFVGIIPALQMLHPPHGPANIAIDPLVQLFWALSLTYFGIFFAVPLRRQVILVEQLRFPSGTATAKLIEVLHTRDDVRASQNVARMSARQSGTTPSAFTPNAFTAAATPPHGLPLIAGGSEQLQRARWRSLSLAFSASFLASLLAYFVPSTANLRIFDLVCLPNLSFWHWTIRPSLSYVGQGMIMGLRPAGSAFGGAVLAWGLLGPIALSRGWTAASHANATAPVPTAWGILEPVALSKERTSFNASAPVLTAAACAPTVSAAQIDSWEDGAQGWLLWVALALMLGEAITSLALIIVRQGGPALRACLGAVSAADRRAAAEAAGVEVAPPNHLVPLAWWGPGLLGSGILTVAVVSPLFNMPVWQSAAAVVLSCFVSVRRTPPTQAVTPNSLHTSACLAHTCFSTEAVLPQHPHAYSPASSPHTALTGVCAPLSHAYSKARPPRCELSLPARPHSAVLCPPALRSCLFPQPLPTCPPTPLLPDPFPQTS
jgi:hypothetical protein